MQCQECDSGCIEADVWKTDWAHCDIWTAIFECQGAKVTRADFYRDEVSKSKEHASSDRNRKFEKLRSEAQTGSRKKVHNRVLKCLWLVDRMSRELLSKRWRVIEKKLALLEKVKVSKSTHIKQVCSKHKSVIDKILKGFLNALTKDWTV